MRVGEGLTTINIATIMATPSTQSTGGSSFGRGVPKSWKNPKASETTAAIHNRICRKNERLEKSGYEERA